MSLLHIALGVLGVGSIAGVAIGLIFAPAIVKPILGAIVEAVSSAVTWLLKHPAIALAIACAVFALLEWQDARHWKKTDAGHVALLSDVNTEVSLGVGKPTNPADAPFYIHHFVENIATLKSINAREEAGIRQSHADADAARAGAHQDAQPTTDERDREKVRQRINDPARTTGLTADEWSQM